METLSLFDQGHLKLTTPVPLTQHPAGVYLASLSPGSVVTMRQSLNTMASLLTRGECDAFTLDWSNSVTNTLLLCLLLLNKGMLLLL